MAKYSNTIGKIILFGVLALLITYIHANNAKSDLIIEVTDIKNNEGVVRISLYNNEENFNKHTSEKAVIKATAKIVNKKAKIIIHDVPHGTYAAIIFHDEDSSGTFKQGFLGIPLEGFGFSGNPKIMFKQPSFTETSFILNEPTKKITIKMINNIK